ncbi:two-component system, LuxR family, response regulator FixJ [Methylocapsa palsarum]|uniref:Two-component system, LuxR family, response regulator FixJ n=3 Tax=Methylocapsa palsarum TaxID=1612308 RepID=A0A1I4DHU4_9HYPH|nr:two-component system, LuxR family, response regulator FixJ [Methylocapsa palsarum]
MEPAPQALPPKEPAPQEPASKAPASKPLSEPCESPMAAAMVHVIDDEAAVRDSLSLLLSLNGYDARAYESAAAFLAALDAGLEAKSVPESAAKSVGGASRARSGDKSSDKSSSGKSSGGNSWTATGVGPGCVVTDVRMPGVGGMELLARLKQGGALLPVIVMTGHGDIPLAVEAMKGGAADFLEKPFDAETLLAAVRTALAAAHAGPGAAEARLVRQKLGGLTPRENEILAELVAGRQNRAIAERLSISVRTVEVHRASIMAKMDAGNVSQLLRMVLTSQR